MTWHTFVHIGVGFLGGLMSIHNPVASLTITAFFLAYEFSQQWTKSDPAYQEIVEYTIGFIIGM